MRAGLTEEDLADPAKFASAHVMLSLGAALFIAGLAYKALPFDLIPDWIPFVGRLDDMAAGLVAGIGACPVQGPPDRPPARGDKPRLGRPDHATTCA